jgi:hypothetical protein
MPFFYRIFISSPQSLSGRCEIAGYYEFHLPVGELAYSLAPAGLPYDRMYKPAAGVDRGSLCSLFARTA